MLFSHHRFLVQKDITAVFEKKQLHRNMLKLVWLMYFVILVSTKDVVGILCTFYKRHFLLLIETLDGKK